MNILFVSQEVPPETAWGGIGTYVDVLSKALAARGARVDVLSVAHEQRAEARVIDGVTIRRFSLPGVHRPARALPESWGRLLVSVSVARLVRRLPTPPDVIECPEWMAEGFALSLQRLHPLVVRLHSSARQLFPFTAQGWRCHGLDGRLAVKLEEISVRRANVVLSTRSNLDEAAASMRLDTEAIHAIPLPIRLPLLSPLPEAAPPRVMFAGRLEPRKAPDVLLGAIPKVLAQVPDARFVFVGRDGVDSGLAPSASWLRAEARRLGVERAVEFTGQLDRRGVEEQLRASTVCAFPSRWESFGNAVAEASAIGRPVVVSPIPAFKELVADRVTGRVAPLDDPDGWAEVLTDVLQDRQSARRMGSEGARLIARMSAPDHIADLTYAAYLHAIERWREARVAGRARQGTVRTKRSKGPRHP